MKWTENNIRELVLAVGTCGLIGGQLFRNEICTFIATGIIIVGVMVFNKKIDK